MDGAASGTGMAASAAMGELDVAAAGEASGACASAVVLLAAQPARNRAMDPTCNMRTALDISILMATLYITHPACRLHEMGSWHPEGPDRLDAINDQMLASGV